MTHEEWQLSTIGRFINSHKAWETAQAEMKERCARVCDNYAASSSNPMNFAENCAAAIRALKEA